MKKFLIVAAALALTACTSENDATRALTAAGYTDIHITGYKFFACSDDDFFHTGFQAVNPAGALVDGTVCSGLIFKAATIRY